MRMKALTMAAVGPMATVAHHTAKKQSVATYKISGTCAAFGQSMTATPAAHADPAKAHLPV